MPEVFSSFHDYILKHFFNTGQEITINNIMHTWSLDHQGYCFSANVFAKIISLPNDYEIMGLIHKLNDMDYIITDSDGEISAIGKKLSSLINIPPKEFIKFHLNIQLIAPKLMSVYKEYFIVRKYITKHKEFFPHFMVNSSYLACLFFHTKEFDD